MSKRWHETMQVYLSSADSTHPGIFVLPSDLWADCRAFANAFALLDIENFVLTGAGGPTFVAYLESAPVISALDDAWSPLVSAAVSASGRVTLSKLTGIDVPPMGALRLRFVLTANAMNAATVSFNFRSDLLLKWPCTFKQALWQDWFWVVFTAAGDLPISEDIWLDTSGFEAAYVLVEAQNSTNINQLTLNLQTSPALYQATSPAWPAAGAPRTFATGGQAIVVRVVRGDTNPLMAILKAIVSAGGACSALLRITILLKNG